MAEYFESHKRIELRMPSSAHFLWLFVILSLLSVFPFWAVRYPLICDYPNHLARWFVLHHLQDPNYRFSELYVPAWGPLPYVSVDVLAVALQRILPIDIVGRCILSLCIISVAIAGFLFLRNACPENASLALFGILVAFNPMFLMGSISYEMSLAFCLLTVSFWVSYCASPRISTALCVLLGLLLTYFSHLIGCLLAGLVMGVYGLFTQSRWKTTGVLAALSAPTLAVMCYNLRQPGAAGGNFYADMTVWGKFIDLVFPVRFYSSKIQDATLLGVLGILAVLLIFKQQRIIIQRAWLAVCGTLLIAYLIAPHWVYADSRVMPFLFFFMLPVFRFPRIPRYLVVVLAALVVFRVASVERLFKEEQPKLQELTAGFEAIPRDAKVLQIGVPDVRRGGLLEVRGPTFHLFYGVIRRGFLAPTLYHLPGVQPVRLVDGFYCPNVLCWPQNPSEAELRKLALSYDYLWVQKEWLVPAIPSSITDQIFSNDYLAVYRFKHQR